MAEAAGKTVRYVHDWRSCEGSDNDARNLMIAWGKAGRSHTRQTLILLSPNLSPFARIAASTAVTLLRAGGVKLAFVDSLDSLVAELVPPAAAGSSPP